MNAFLVIGKEQSFDAVLALFDNRSTAVDFADDVNENDVIQSILREVGDQLEFELFPKCVGIVEFIEGSPCPFEVVKEFADATAICDE